MKKSPSDYLALALDNFSSLQEVSTIIRLTSGSIGVYKIGLELFTRFGPPVLDMVRACDRKIFLDLKFHDIPNTVGKAVDSACALGVDFLTVHVQGGLEMMRAAKSAADSARSRGTVAPAIVGVTLLTSINEDSLHNELVVPMASSAYVRHLASLAAAAALDGIVCSAADLPAVKPTLPGSFEIVTPGIRPTGAAIHDQKRIATPRQAIENGATLLVLGRAVTEADDPGKAAVAIVSEIS